MNKLSRRQFLLDATAVPLALWLPGSAALAQAAPLARHDIASPEGAAMLEVYANAIRAMRTRSQTDPLGWQWQWYTHFVNGTTNKAAELTRLFGTTPSARRALADEVWNTCQPHSGQNANFFFPWHRMYTYYMERIVRRVSGVANFTMPYWDYTSSDPARRGVVPGQFRLPNHPVYGVLYRAERNPLANAGLPIHRDQPGDAMNMDDAMARVRYETIGAVQGFCRAVDAGIHGRIHVLVGNARGMGNVPYAANDPLFLVHHSNVDRMWVSWIRNGHSNPTDATLSPWITGAFALVDSNGARVSRQCRELFSASQMGYVYSRYLPPPKTPARESPRASQPHRRLHAWGRRPPPSGCCADPGHVLPRCWAWIPAAVARCLCSPSCMRGSSPVCCTTSTCPTSPTVRAMPGTTRVRSISSTRNSTRMAGVAGWTKHWARTSRVSTSRPCCKRSPHARTAAKRANGCTSVSCPGARRWPARIRWWRRSNWWCSPESLQSASRSTTRSGSVPSARRASRRSPTFASRTLRTTWPASFNRIE